MHANLAQKSSKPAQPGPDANIFWKSAAAASAGLLLLWIILFFAGVWGRPAAFWPAGAETSAAARIATEFLTRTLTFSAAQNLSQKADLLETMTPEFQQAFQLVWQDPKLVQALKKREAQVSVACDLPVFKARDNQGNYFFLVSGRVTVASPVTVIHAVERAFAGTVLVVKTDRGFKVANAVWENKR